MKRVTSLSLPSSEYPPVCTQSDEGGCFVCVCVCVFVSLQKEHEITCWNDPVVSCSVLVTILPEVLLPL